MVGPRADRMQFGYKVTFLIYYSFNLGRPVQKLSPELDNIKWNRTDALYIHKSQLRYLIAGVIELLILDSTHMVVAQWLGPSVNKVL